MTAVASTGRRSLHLEILPLEQIDRHRAIVVEALADVAAFLDQRSRLVNRLDALGYTAYILALTDIRDVANEQSAHLVARQIINKATIKFNSVEMYICEHRCV